MEFNEHYDFFFDNHGKCPYCGEFLVPCFGCKNLACEYNKDLFQKDRDMDGIQRLEKIERTVKVMAKYRKEFAEYWQWVRERSFLARIKRNNLDNGNKKSYSNDI